jgi:hypothetical protein
VDHSSASPAGIRGAPTLGDEPMDPATEVRMSFRGALRPLGAGRRVEPSLQIEEATLDHWEILLGDPKLCVRI